MPKNVCPPKRCSRCWKKRGKNMERPPCLSKTKVVGKERGFPRSPGGTPPVKKTESSEKNIVEKRRRDALQKVRILGGTLHLQGKKG